MKKKIAMLAIAGTSIGMFAAVPTASAAHCIETNEKGEIIGDQPGFSYFGQDGREEGAPRGASSCRDATGSPSERAPGRNR